MQHPRRLGMLVPSSNVVLEPETAKLVPADGPVTVHVSRLRVLTISGEDSSSTQFETERFLAAAGLLADAEVDLILWNGTAASWLGFEKDMQLTETIARHLSIPATTSVLAINAELASLGAKRIGLVTPYVEALESQIARNYAGIGIEVAAAERLNLTVNTDFGRVPPEEVAEMCRQVAKARPDAIVVMCTNLAGASVAEPLGRELGIPVIDSVRSSVLHSLRLLETPLAA